MHNQSIDPIVSILASRLRLALAQYYETAGKNDPIRIDIPKGGYVPTFDEQLRGDQPITAEQAAPVDVMQTWSMLASLYADNCGLETVDHPTPLEKAVAYAQKGVSLDPTNRRARAILVYVRLLENKLPEARCQAEKAYNLYSCSLLYLDVIGWLMSLAGEWERGVSYIKKAVQLNPYYRPWVRHPLCINWFRLGNYEKAYRETLNFKIPECHWDLLLKASACGHLGKIEEGQACVRALLALKPDFAQRGRILIDRYVKFEDINDRIIEGLGNLEMNIGS